MDNRKSVNKTGDKREDSATSIVSSDESFASSNETVTLKNSQEISSQVIGSTSLLMELLCLDSNESPSSRNNSQGETAVSKSPARFDSCYPSSFSKASQARNAPEFTKQLGPSNPLSMKKIEACQPNEPLKARYVFRLAPKEERKEHEKVPLRAMARAISREARNQPEVKSEIKIDPLKEISTSTYQSLVSDSTANLPSSSYVASNSGKFRNTRKSTKKTSDKMEDSEMSSVFLDASFSYSNETALKNWQELSLDWRLRDWNESSSRNNSQAELHKNPTDELLSELHAAFIFCCQSARNETLPTRNPPEFPKQLGPSHPLSTKKAETCQPNEPLRTKHVFQPMGPKKVRKEHEKVPLRAKMVRLKRKGEGHQNRLLPMKHAISISDEARNLPAVENDIILDPSEVRTSTSTHQQPLVQDGASTKDQPTFSHDTSNSGKSRESMCGQIEPRSDKFTIYASEAQTLLQSVLKEIMQYNEEKDQLKRFALQFPNDFESSKKYGSHMGKDVMNYLPESKTGLSWKNSPYLPREMTMETYVLGVYEMLTSVVVSALILTSTAQSSRDFDGFIMIYESLRCLYDTFSHYWEINNIEVIEDEASRNRLKSMKKMIQRLLLVTLTACRLFLMYVGENAEKENLRKYEEHLPDEDKTYLGRNN